jgi:NADH-quinone oxidoreductase subunit C
MTDQPTKDMFGASGLGDTSGFGHIAVRPPDLASTPKPYGGWFDEATDALESAYGGFGDAIERVVVHRGELTLVVKRESFLDLLRVLRDDPRLRFEHFSSVSGVDYPNDPTGRRLHAVYHLLSMTYRRRLRLEVCVSDADPHVPSATEIYPTANWHERETWDFFGIIFDGHPGLTRIEMPDDWPGHPQRKDYPLGGVPVEYKGAQVPPPDERRSYA